MAVSLSSGCYHCHHYCLLLSPSRWLPHGENEQLGGWGNPPLLPLPFQSSVRAGQGSVSGCFQAGRPTSWAPTQTRGSSLCLGFPQVLQEQVAEASPKSLPWGPPSSLAASCSLVASHQWSSVELYPPCMDLAPCDFPFFPLCHSLTGWPGVRDFIFLNTDSSSANQKDSYPSV